jgi:hypothetical protein
VDLLRRGIIPIGINGISQIARLSDRSLRDEEEFSASSCNDDTACLVEASGEKDLTQRDSLDPEIKRQVRDHDEHCDD